jgi:putative FmdB family regulatory protein
MPTYEYRCLDCGHRFEQFQRIQDAPVDTCPQCGGRVERLISGGSGVIFKGSGFYITDYKRKQDRAKPEIPKEEKKPKIEKPKKKTEVKD